MSLVPVRTRELVGGDVWSEVDRMQRELNRLFGSSLSRWPEWNGEPLESAWVPAVDIQDQKDRYVVTADLPGFQKEQIQVTCENNVLTIKGEREEKKEEKHNGYLRRERTSGSFYRAMTIPSGTDSGQMKASYKDGVLELILPKKEEAKTKQIKVEVK